MRRLALSLIVISAGSFRPAHAVPNEAADAASTRREYKELTAGRYSLKVTGMLCHACARTLVLELGKLEEVRSVKADFEAEQVLLEIPLERVLPVSRLRKALQRASKRINLGTRLEITDIRYLP